MSILVIFKLLGSLSLLMFGMKSMSDALQKMVGSQLRHVLGAKPPTDSREYSVVCL